MRLTRLPDFFAGFSVYSICVLFYRHSVVAIVWCDRQNRLLRAWAVGYRAPERMCSRIFLRSFITSLLLLPWLLRRVPKWGCLCLSLQ